MANTVATIRPNGVASNTWTLGGGAPDAASATNDNNDATFLSSVSGGDALLNMGTVAIPALAQVRSVTPRVRAKPGGSNVANRGPYRVVLNGVVGAGNFVSPPDTLAIYNYSGGALTTRPTDGAAWTQADIDAIQLEIIDIPGLAWYEGYIDVAYNQAPVVSAVTAPSGSITTTLTPAVAWTYTDPEGDAQERFQVKIFSAAQYGIGGFDPEVSPYTVASGEVLSGTAAWTPTLPVTPGVTYKAYVKVADVGSNGRYGLWVAGPTFSIQIDVPNAPVVTTVVDNTLARIAVTVAGQDNLLTANQSTAEVDATGMVADNACTVSRVTTAGSFFQGIAAWQMAATGAAARMAITPVATAAVVPGQAMTVTARVKASTAITRNGRMLIRWYQANGTTLISTTTGGGVVVNNSGHALVVANGTAPALAAWAVAVVEITDSINTDVIWVDAVGVLPGTSTVWGKGGFVPTQKVLVERSLDGGVTWSTMRGGNYPAMTAQTLTLYDYEVPRGITPQYRAKVQATDALLAYVVYSLLSGVAIAASAMASTGWWLKDPLAPGLNMQLDVQPGFSFHRKEPQTVYEPLGRPNSVVVTDGVKGIEGSMDVWSKDATRYAKLAAIVATGHNLWLEDNLGRAWYVKLGSATQWSMLRAVPLPTETTPLRHMHSVTLPIVEVGTPPADAAVAAGTPSP